ncbi:hypothetical protein J1C67_13670 [Clostridium gasigenes]|uniref:hypothetical protein n=1 Tax=Clostridium gasigenes TaxID=94869 RepID=UPI00143839A5|nr:hypothetical protein [Clostridium gasigenes]NKF08448.1 hypothetical protein [Clostridium gasigenes]QSW18588.1 hypothetical protein J1C67_13670 [Clostridium gasigenes]
MIWGQFIIVQEFICGIKVTTKIIPKVIASIGVGILYSITGNIIVPMIAPGLEIRLDHWIKQNFS